MSVLTHPAPALRQEYALSVVRRLYGINGRLVPLAAERDQNFRLDADDGQRYVVKFANAREPAEVTAFQAAVLNYLASVEPGLPIPRVKPSLEGKPIVFTSGLDSERHAVRVVTWLPGKPFADAEKTPALMNDLGRLLGRLDRALQGFSHRGAVRELEWDIRLSGEARKRLGAIDNPDRRALLERLLDRFDSEIEPQFKWLRAQVIHGDANDWNVFVDEEDPDRISGLIDFGDAMHTLLIGELAVAAAYAILDQTDPMAVVTHLVAGYHKQLALLQEEADVLFDLILMRLVTSVTISAKRREKIADNPYLAVSERPAWDMLERLGRVEPMIGRGIVRQACGFAAARGARRAIGWLKANKSQLAPLLRRPIAPMRKEIVPLGDARHPITVASRDNRHEEATRLWREWSQGQRLEISLGPWGELRTIYSGDAFVSRLIAGKRRDMHLGIDVFAEAGTSVFTPLAGRIVDVDFRPDSQDYGGMVLMAHEPQPRVRFYSLWGHLSKASVEALKPGEVLRAGDKVAELGAPHENGGWIPHLHLQLATAHPGAAWNVPGVGEADYERLWSELYPSAVDFAGLEPEALSIDHGRSPQELMAARKRLLGGNLSVAYSEPLKIVRGEGVWLIDHTGRAYLDCFNNVAHLGHSHPRVIEALHRQSAILNTNTRYLHDAIIDYAERLTAELPEPLKVCYFVCTGSDANDLAIRMAKAHTGRRDFLTVDWAYHGHTDALIDISPYKYKRAGGTGRPEHVREVPMPDSYRAPPEWPAAELGARYAACLGETVADMVVSKRPPAAFFLESVMSCGGQIFLPEGYMREAFRHVRKAGGICVADEVQIGFGRIGTHMWAFESQGAIPDILTLGKPIGNGHPLAALVTTREIAQSFANGMEYFNTFGGNPVSCAVGLAVLETIEQDTLMENAQDVGGYLLTGLARLQAKHDLIGDVRGQGLFLGLELVKDRRTKQHASQEARRIVEHARDLGVLIGTDGPYDNVVKLRPPMIFTRANADYLLGVLEAVFAAV